MFICNKKYICLLIINFLLLITESHLQKRYINRFRSYLNNNNNLIKKGYLLNDTILQRDLEIMRQNDTIIKLCKNNKKNIICTKDKFGNSYLMIALMYNNIEMIQQLCKFGGKELAMIKNNNDQTCFHLASITNNINIIEELYNLCDKDFLLNKDNLGFTCLHVAVINGYVELVKKFIEFGGKDLVLSYNPSLGIPRAIIYAYDNKNIEIIKLLNKFE